MERQGVSTTVVYREGYDMTQKDTCAGGETATDEAVKEEVVIIFRELLERLWNHLAGLIGETAVVAIFRSAEREVIHRYPFLGEMDVDEGGIRLDRLEALVRDMDRSAVRDGFLMFLNSVITLLTDLTGDILVRKVDLLIGQFRERLEEGSPCKG